jgi:hypothetical protein
MIDTCRETYQEEVWEVFSVHESSKEDHKPVGFDEMVYIIDEACGSDKGQECL